MEILLTLLRAFAFFLVMLGAWLFIVAVVAFFQVIRHRRTRRIRAAKFYQMALASNKKRGQELVPIYRDNWRIYKKTGEPEFREAALYTRLDAMKLQFPSEKDKRLIKAVCGTAYYQSIQTELLGVKL